MSLEVRLLPCGPRAVLAEYADLDTVMAVAAALRADPVPGVIDVVPAARTILVAFSDVDSRLLEHRLGLSDHTNRHNVHLLAQTGEGAELGGAEQVTVRVAVEYDGPDLADVAEHAGLTVDEVVALHRDRRYTVAFCGFMPGFSYLVGLDPRLHLPRRADPRPRVRAGSVAIAAEFTAVYPRDSPGGWHLIGHTEATMWDEEREEPALLPPGARVEFVAR